MTKFLYLGCTLFIVLSTSCNSGGAGHTPTGDATAEQAASVPETKVEIPDSIYNFGKVKEGEKVVFSYRFKNTGDKPLIIKSAHASCGCTVPEKPEEPIAPGESGYIKVIFNSLGTGGIIHKQVRVVSNARPDFPVLNLQGEVMPK